MLLTIIRQEVLRPLQDEAVCGHRAESFLHYRLLQQQGRWLGYPEPKGHNDHALRAVLEGHADAMWVYGDQAENYQYHSDDEQDDWDCDLWNKFGTDFAYIQTGMFPWMHNGTTFAFSKKGSGLNELLNHCIDSFLITEEFYETCKIKHRGHDQLRTCLPNAYI